MSGLSITFTSKGGEPEETTVKALTQIVSELHKMNISLQRIDESYKRILNSAEKFHEGGEHGEVD